MTVSFNIFESQKLSNFVVLNKGFEDVVKDDTFSEFNYVVVNCAKACTEKCEEENKTENCCLLGEKAVEIATLYEIDLCDYAKRENCKGDSGKTVKISLPKVKNSVWENYPENILIVGLGDKTLDDCRKAGLEVGRKTVGAASIYLPFIDELDDEQQVAFFNGVMLSCYRQTRIAQTNDLKDPVSDIYLSTTVKHKVSENIEQARHISEATLLARTLECVPSNIKNPKWLADNFKQLVAECELENLDGELVFECLEAEQLREQGFNSILAVGEGSVTPPCLVTVRWIPNKIRRNSPKIVLVGKGITYDTGGLSLKPRDAMVPMKTDMSGTATVMAAIFSIAKAGLNVEVTAVATMAENTMGAASYRPGDVIRSYDGTTIEIVNTDAEGRMVLADGLGYAVKDLQADIIVDVATLTGSATLGLGRFHAATYSNDSEIWEKMFEASTVIGENVWRMPLPDDYREALESPIADICHCETVDYIGGGSVTAALFLEHFVKSTKWCHLDIAGVGRAGKPMGEVTTNQPTGFGAALLYGFVKEYDK